MKFERIAFAASVAALAGVAAFGRSRVDRSALELARAVEEESRRPHPHLAPPPAAFLAPEWDVGMELHEGDPGATVVRTRARGRAIDRRDPERGPIPEIACEPPAADHEGVTLRWTVTPPKAVPLFRIRIERRAGEDVEVFSVGGSARGWTDQSAAPETTYAYRLTGRCVDGRETASTAWHEVRTPSPRRVSFRNPDAVRGIAQAVIEEYRRGKGWQTTIRTCRLDEPIGDTGLRIVSIVRETCSRARAWCDRSCRIRREIVSFPSAKVRLSDGTVWREAVPAWARDGLCPRHRILDWVQGFATWTRLGF